MDVEIPAPDTAGRRCTCAGSPSRADLTVRGAFVAGVDIVLCVLCIPVLCVCVCVFMWLFPVMSTKPPRVLMWFIKKSVGVV